MRRHDGRNPIDVDSEVVEQAEAVGGQQQNPEQMLARATLDADLQAALDDLPEAFRQAVWLRDVEEFTYAEIAEDGRSADRHGDVEDFQGTTDAV